MQNVDYHVGLIRGFLLAHNAHQSLLHALDCVLTHTRLAGEVICEPKPQEIDHLREIAKKAEQEAKRSAVPCIKEPEGYRNAKVMINKIFVHWSKEEENTMRVLHADGKTTKEIIKAFPNRNYSQVYSKQVSLGLNPHSKQLKEHKEYEEVAG